MSANESYIEIPLITDAFLDLLNEAVKLDSTAMQNLFANRTEVNDAIANHPTIQVRDGKPCTMSVVGLLNGILTPLNGERIAAIYTDDKLIGFTRYEETQD